MNRPVTHMSIISKITKNIENFIKVKKIKGNV